MKIWQSLSTVGGLLAVFYWFFLSSYTPDQGEPTLVKAETVTVPQVSQTIQTTSVMTSLETPMQKRQGTLMLCGGGKLPEEIRSRFFSLGGANNGSFIGQQ
jgi:hypothetical protein